MKKYYIAIAILVITMLGLLGFTLAQAANSKQDNVTEKKVEEVVNKLNDYTSTKQGVPDKLDILGVKDIPSTIKYTKNSSAEYKFCVTYKAAKSYGYGSVQDVLWGAATRQLSQPQDYSSTNTSGTPDAYLYMDTTHKKGETCKTIQPLFYRDGGTIPVATSGTPTTVSDTEREVDIKALHGQIEAYYAQNGKYPTLANLNDNNWLVANLKGLDKEALRDPAGSDYTLMAAPVSSSYSYEPKASDGLTCDNTSYDCVSYTLTTKFDDGTSFSKVSLN